MIAIWHDLAGWVLSIGGLLVTLFFRLVLIGVVGFFALEILLCLCVIAFRNPVAIFAWRSIAWLVRTSWFWVRGPGHAVRYRKGE